MNLAAGNNAEKFRQMLDQAAAVKHRLTDWEQGFVDGLLEQFDGREDQIDLGMTPWNPTVNQWNTLHGIVSKL